MRKRQTPCGNTGPPEGFIRASTSDLCQVRWHREKSSCHGGQLCRRRALCHRYPSHPDSTRSQMIAELLDNLIAELGDGECPRSAQEFTQELDWHTIASVLIVAVFALAMSATASLISTRRQNHKRLLWIFAIWLVPVAGATIWLCIAPTRVRIRKSRPTCLNRRANSIQTRVLRSRSTRDLKHDLCRPKSSTRFTTTPGRARPAPAPIMEWERDQPIVITTLPSAAPDRSRASAAGTSSNVNV